MEVIIEDLLIGDLVRLDGKIIKEGFWPQIEMTFQGKVLCIRRGENVYDFITSSFYKEMKRYKFSGLQINDLLEGELYVKDLEPINNYIFGYLNDRKLERSVLEDIKIDLEERGLYFAENKEVNLKRIK